MTKILAILAMSLIASEMTMAQSPNRLIVLDPGHFHATLLQKEMYPELAPEVGVYAPLGPELLDYLNRISLFNSRGLNPTKWNLNVHTSDNPIGAMLRDRAGDIVVFSGRNRGKIDNINAALDAGFHVLADKPWIIDSKDLPKLEQSLDTAARKGLGAYDIMTERYEVSSQLQKALVNLPAVFGTQVPGSSEKPGVQAYSIHHIMKIVAGVPLRRPTWFFDVDDYGEGLADVGTHPVDLIQWTLFPDQLLDFRKDVKMMSGRHEAVKIDRAQFAKVTGTAEFPASLKPHVRDGVLDYYCDNHIEYALKGVHIKLDVLWKWEAAAGTGDVYEAAFQGTKSRVELRQNAAGQFVPEVYVVPTAAARAEVFAALELAVKSLQSRWPGLRIDRTETEAHLRIPQQFRIAHEEHFAQVARHFFEYVKNPSSTPAWERGYMLTKYYVTTAGVDLARK